MEKITYLDDFHLHCAMIPDSIFMTIFVAFETTPATAGLSDSLNS
jgi:hypothetical protein